MRVFPVRGKGMAAHAKRFFARRRVIHRSCGEQTLRALLASMNNSGETISRRSFRENGERPPERRRMAQHPGEGCQTRTPGRRPQNPRRPPATIWQPSGLAAPEGPNSSAVTKGDSYAGSDGPRPSDRRPLCSLPLRSLHESWRCLHQAPACACSCWSCARKARWPGPPNRNNGLDGNLPETTP